MHSQATIVFVKTLESFLKSNGARLLHIANNLGQRDVFLEYRALYKYFPRNTPYKSLSDVLEKISRDNYSKKFLEKLGIIILNDGVRINMLYVKNTLNSSGCR